MKRLKLIILSLVAIASIGFAFAPTVYAVDYATSNNIDKLCEDDPGSSICKDLDDPDPEAKLSNTWRNVINILLSIGGIIAIVVIIMSGIRFSASRGESSNVSQARNTLLFAVVGLVVIIIAFAVVNFVIAQLSAV